MSLRTVARAVLLSTGLAWWGTASATTEGFRLEPAEKLRQFDTYDALAERRGDLVVFERGGQWWARYLTFAVSMPYEQREPLIASVKASVSVASVTQTSPSLRLPRVRDWTGSGDSEQTNQEIDKRERMLQEAGINLASYRQTEIVSAPLYGNRQEGVYSEVALSVVDAEPIFRRDCTLVTVTRVDRTREWARLTHTPIVLPFRIAASTRVVTSAELDTARAIMRRLGKKFSDPVLTGSLLEPLRSSSTLLELKELVDAVCPKTQASK